MEKMFTVSQETAMPGGTRRRKSRICACGTTKASVLVERCSLHAKYEMRHLIFVHGSGVTPSVLSKLNCQEDFKVEIFNKIELMTNPLKSELAPLHTTFR